MLLNPIIMKTTKKVYRVVAHIGRKRNIVWESVVFDANDGVADYAAYKDAVRAKTDHCTKLWRDGFSFTTDGRYHHIGKDIEAGRIEIERCSK